MAEENQSSPVTVRRAAAKDVVKILEFLQSRDPGVFFSVDEMRALQSIAEVITTGYVRVAVDGDKIVGAIGLAAYVPDASAEMILDGQWFAVDPDYSNMGVGLMLVRLASKFARSKDVAVRLTLCRQDRNEVRDAVLTKLGYQSSAVVYTLEREKKNEKLVEENVDPDN